MIVNQDKKSLYYILKSLLGWFHWSKCGHAIRSHVNYGTDQVA